MKTQTLRLAEKTFLLSVVILMWVGFSAATLASPAFPKSNQPDTLTYIQYKGSVIDQEADYLKPAGFKLEFA